MVALADADRAAELKELLPPGIAIEAGPDAMAAVAVEADVAVNGVVGFAGLPVTMATLAAGKRLALANKESLIAAGPVVASVRATPGAELVPVDSEHCAVHQCLRAGEGTRRLARIVLTASGGPFRGRGAEDLAEVTVDEALAHPTWSMGPKITVDSSTLMNKGLEVIEAHELFDVDYDHIDVVVHPAVDRALDGRVHRRGHHRPAVDARHAAAHRVRAGVSRTASERPSARWTSPRRDRWTSSRPTGTTFRCLGLAYDAGRAGGTAPAWLSAANEVAVDAFLAGRISWSAIAATLAEALGRWDGSAADSLDAVLAADAAARQIAERSSRHRSDRVTDRRPADRSRPATRQPRCDDGQGLRPRIRSTPEPPRPTSSTRSVATPPGSSDRRSSAGCVSAILLALIVLLGVTRGLPILIVVAACWCASSCTSSATTWRRVVRHEGDGVLHRVRSADLLVPPRRDRVRDEGHSGRRLRQHHRHEQPRGGRSRRRVARLPTEALPVSASVSRSPDRPCTS